MFHTFYCTAGAGHGHYYVVARAATEEEARVSSVKVNPPINECRLVSQYDNEEIGTLELSPEMTLSLDKTGVGWKYFPAK